MARIESSKCPQCGAALEVDPRSEVVTCHYCGHRSIVEWQGRQRPPTVQVEQWRVDPSFGRIAVQAPRPGFALGIVLVTAILPIVMAGVIFGVTRSRATRTTTVTIPGMPAIPVVPTATVANKVDAPDPRKVDIAEVVRQAHALAVAQEPHVDKLSSVVAFNVTGGMLDTTQQNAASIDFSFRYTDPTKPPGQKDVVEGSVSVHVTGGGMNPRTQSAFYRDKALADPKCSSRDAWATAVKSGVPENAVTTFHLYDNSPFSPKSPTVWSIRVDGHDEYRREIDATNCALVKSWGDSGKKSKR